MKEFLALFIVFVIFLGIFSLFLVPQVSLAQQGLGESCNCLNDDCSTDTCDFGLKCACDPDPTDSNVMGRCIEQDATAFCSPTSHTSIASMIEAISNWIFYFGVIFAPLMIVIGAFMLLTSAGDPKKVERGRKTIIWAAIGLVIIFASKLLVSVIKNILGA